MFAQMYFMPKDGPARELFDFTHYQDHLAIVRKIQSKLGIMLGLHQIYPRPADFQTFLYNHQSLHVDMARAVKQVSKRDLIVLDNEDEQLRQRWAWRNWDQHLTVHRELGLS